MVSESRPLPTASAVLFKTEDSTFSWTQLFRLGLTNILPQKKSAGWAEPIKPFLGNFEVRDTETPIRGHQSPVQEHIDSRVQSWDAKDVWWGKQRSAAEVTEVVRLSRSGLTFGLLGYSSQDACLYCYCCCSVAQSYLTLCNPMDCSTPGFLVLHCLPEVAQTHVHWVSDACHPTISSSATPFPSFPQSFPASGSFPVSQFFTSGGQDFGASASASVLPMNIQGWLVWSPCSLGDSQAFSSTTVWGCLHAPIFPFRLLLLSEMYY